MMSQFKRSITILKDLERKANSRGSLKSGREGPGIVAPG
jgi:hypothetical protein